MDAQADRQRAGCDVRNRNRHFGKLRKLRRPDECVAAGSHGSARVRKAADPVHLAPLRSAATHRRLLDVLECRPSGVAELVGHVLDAAPAPAAGSATRAKIRLFKQDQLGIAGNPTCKTVGQTECMVNGSAVMASAPPTPAASDRHAGRTMFT